MTDNENDLRVPSLAEQRRDALPVAIRDTNLGLYISTRNGRYLLAFVAHVVGGLAILMLVFSLFKGAYYGVMLGPDKDIFYDSVVFKLGVASLAFVIGSVAEAKMLNAIKAALICSFVFFIHSQRG